MMGTLQKREIVAVIPARGGSKGIPGKNLRVLAGKPLIAYTILAAKEAKCVTKVYVSTDDAGIARVSKKYGAEVILRPKNISGDRASSEAALQHALLKLERTGIHPDLVVFLQCTSPIRTGKDIDRAIKDMDQAKADSLLSVVPFHRFIWQKHKGKVRSSNYDFRARPRRQDLIPEYMENGSIYVFKPGILRKYNNRLGGRIAFSQMDYWSSIDIDTAEDLKMCQWIMKKVH